MYLVCRFSININALSNYISYLLVTCACYDSAFILILRVFDGLVGDMHFESFRFHFLNAPLILFLLLSDIGKHTLLNESFHELELI
jgi:hypothetical protein